MWRAWRAQCDLSEVPRLSLHPIKPRKAPRAKRGYGSLRVEKGWDTGEKKESTFTNFGKWRKVGILLGVILFGLLATSYAYYSNIYLPSQPPTSPNYDPFTLLWNG